MGTPLYMSPEQVSGKALDARSDIYSLGVMAFHMLAGQPPFTGETALSVAVKHLNEQPPSLADSRPDVPVGVRMLIERMMAKKKEERPADAQAVLNEIKQLMRQVTSKEAPATLETAFRPSSPGASQLGSLLLKRPVRLQLGWLAGACLLMATCMAGIGWAMRTSDPFKTPAHAGDPKVKDLGTIDGQYMHAQGNPTNESGWYAAKAKLTDATDSAHLRMRDRCDLNLAMIYLHTRRVEQARQIFSDFASSTDLWRRAHGIAGKAIVEDLQGSTADRKAIAQYAEQAEALVRQLDRDGHLDTVVETALRDVLQRGEKQPK
jgi:serine/threonine-protein kinase